MGGGGVKIIDPTLTGHLKGDTYGGRMRASRTHAGLTQKEAADLIGLSVAQLSRTERGGVGMASDPTTLVRAARAYGVSDVWLYAGNAAGEKLVPAWYGAPVMGLAA